MNIYKKIIVTFLILLFFNKSVYSNEKLKETEFIFEVKKNWPFLAFASIPDIDDTNFLVSFQVDETKSYVLNIQCIEIFYHKLTKKFNKKVKLEKKHLKDLLCYSTKRALSLIKKNEYFEILSPKTTKGLAFNFISGEVSFIELPHPPINPEIILEDLFTYNLNEEDIGEIIIPEIFTSEINETKI